MKIYTKTGDSGKTSLFQGPRVLKNHDLICAYGTVDELNSQIGIVRTHALDKPIDQKLDVLQNTLFSLGADLATPYPDISKRPFDHRAILTLEEEIDAWQQTLTPLKNFILPGGSKASAQVHLARCICRRAERGCVFLLEEGKINPYSFEYLNRLSDWLFVLARYMNHVENIEDRLWITC